LVAARAFSANSGEHHGRRLWRRPRELLPAALRAEARSPSLTLPPRLFPMRNRGLGSSPRELRRVVHGATVNLRGNRLPDRAYSWERTRIALLSPSAFGIENRAL
jgi:hypothetical protein